MAPMHAIPGRPARALAATALAVALAAAAAPAPADAAAAQPPLGGSPRPLKLPAVADATLPNGMVVRIVEDHRFPLVTARLAFRFGTAADPADLPGLAAATTELLREGTARMTSRQIAEELAAIGGQMSAEAGSDALAVEGSALSEFLPRLAALLADVVQAPTFPESEVALRKQNMKQELMLNRSQPAWLALERFSKEVYGPHPYAVVGATTASIEALSREAIAAFHKERFHPAAAVLVVVGDVRKDDALGEIRARFGGWKGSPPARPSHPSPPARASRKVLLVDRPGSVQSDLRIGGLAPRRADEGYFAALVLDQILGGGAASRMFLTIREQKGLAYDAHSELSARLLTGDWAAVTQVRTEMTKAALEEVLAQMDRLRSEKVSEKELQDAKNYIVGVFTLRLERPGFFADLLADQIVFGLPADALETYVSRVLAVTPDEVQRAAAALLDTSRAVVVVVGDGAKVREAVSGFGPVVAYDTEGRALQAASTAGP